MYDLNGTSASMQIATLPTGLAINNNDISVIDSTALGSSPLTDISVSNITTLGY